MSQIKFIVNYDYRKYYRATITVYTDDYQILEILKDTFDFKGCLLIDKTYSASKEMNSDIGWNNLEVMCKNDIPKYVNKIKYILDMDVPNPFSETYEI